MSGKKVDPVTGEVEVAEAVATAVTPEKRRGDVISAFIYSDTDRVQVAATDSHKAIIEDILSSETVDDVLAQNEAEALENFVGRVVTIREFSVNDSDFQDGAPIYVALKLTDEETGERRVATSGEQNVIAQLLRLEQLKAFPIKVRPYQSKRPNQHGRYMIRFGKADD